jgi:hypothetical protein
MKPTLPQIKKIIKKAHPKMAGLKVVWVKRPFWLETKSGFNGWWSRVEVEAEGYAPKVMLATIGEGGSGRLCIGQ